MQADWRGLQDASRTRLRVRHVPHSPDGQIGRRKAAQPAVYPEPLLRLQKNLRGQIGQLLDCPLLVDRKDRRHLYTLLDGEWDSADQVIAGQRVMAAGLPERGSDALRMLFDSDDGRAVVNLSGQPSRESLREQVGSATNFEIAGELPGEGLVAQHEERGPGFHAIVDTSETLRTQSCIQAKVACDG
jgi:hypothetical protein